MVDASSETTTRRDYHREQLFEIYCDTLADTLSEEEAAERAKRGANEQVRKEDERLWAHYWDPLTETTQLDARGRAQRVDYPSRYQVSQSTISRRLSSLDYDMLTQPVETLGMSEPLLAEAQVDDLDTYEFEHILDVYRRVLARFMVDFLALGKCMNEAETPGWAADRFEDVSPTVGRELYSQQDVDGGKETTPPKAKSGDD